MIHHFIFTLIIISEGAFPCSILNDSVLFIRYQSNTASAVLETITNIQPKESGGGVGETREAIVYRLSEDMLSKLPPDYIPHEVSCPLPPPPAPGPVHRAASGLHGVEHSPGTVCFSPTLSLPSPFPSVGHLFLTLAPSCKITIRPVPLSLSFSPSCLFCTLSPSLGSSGLESPEILTL